MFKIKNYLLVWNESRSFTIHDFVRKIMENDYNVNELIKINNDYIHGEYQFIMLHNEPYKIWSNIVVGNKNIIAIEKVF